MTLCQNSTKSFLKSCDPSDFTQKNNIKRTQHSVTTLQGFSLIMLQLATQRIQAHMGVGVSP
jgi:hypothetical protein